jgi:hypothetical protein
MPTYHLPDPLRPLLDWTARYAARHLPWGPLTPPDAAHVIRTIDAVCDEATANELPFDRYAALEDLAASLADWLRHVSPDRVPAPSPVR